MDLPFERGFKLYLKCIDNIKQKLEKEVKDHVRQIWLIEIQNGYKGDFEKYYKSKVSVSNDRSLGKDERQSEEDRIINKVKDHESIKLQEKEVII